MIQLQSGASMVAILHFWSVSEKLTTFVFTYELTGHTCAKFSGNTAYIGLLSRKAKTIVIILRQSPWNMGYSNLGLYKRNETFTSGLHQNYYRNYFWYNMVNKTWSGSWNEVEQCLSQSESTSRNLLIVTISNQNFFRTISRNVWLADLVIIYVSGSVRSLQLLQPIKVHFSASN